ncbi:MAG TPA: amidophosphoribosyltransferase, partial [Candidatus Saccharimonadales bacterium]|nr:amidophosphoribosyltransferase [Candidatus Saccharimonadales bacterium]
MIAGEVGSQIAVGHNGHIENAPEVAAHYDIDIKDCPTDTAIVTKVLSYLRGLFRGDLDLAMQELLPRFNGAYSMVISERVASKKAPGGYMSRLHAVRDPWGIRPLVIGHMPDGSTVVASEPAGLYAMGATFGRDVEPGEIYSVTQEGVKRARIVRERDQEGNEVKLKPRPCALETVYLAREDDTAVYEAREEMGRRLAKLFPVDADLVIGVPSSGLLSAQGYAEESGLPLKIGFRRSPYISRTFIQPDQALREAMVRLKLSPIAAVMKDKRIVLDDDSIIRGTTMRAIIALMKEKPERGGGGAAEVHLRIPSAKNKWPCYYGTDTGNPDDLLARKFNTNQEMADYLGADSLEFLPPEELASAIGREVGSLCMACMDGNYPTDQPERVRRVLLGLPGVRIPTDALIGPLGA